MAQVVTTEIIEREAEYGKCYAVKVLREREVWKHAGWFQKNHVLVKRDRVETWGTFDKNGLPRIVYSKLTLNQAEGGIAYDSTIFWTPEKSRAERLSKLIQFMDVKVSKIYENI